MTDSITRPERIMSATETAQMLGISERTLARLTGLPKVRLSPGRIGFSLSGINAWVAERTATQNAS